MLIALEMKHIHAGLMVGLIAAQCTSKQIKINTILLGATWVLEKARVALSLNG
jgi:hypothetical protein